MNKDMISFFVQFIKFGLVGFSNTVISYTLYALLTYIGVPYLLASIVGFVVSVLNSFFLNDRYVFSKNYGEKRNPYITLAKTFLSYSLTGLLLSNILLVLFIEKGGINKFLAPILVLVITIPLNFLINKFWAFKVKDIETNLAKRDLKTNEKN